MVRHGSNFQDPLPSSCPIKIVRAGIMDGIHIELRDAYSNVIESTKDFQDMYTFLRFNLSLFNGSTNIIIKGITNVQNIPNPDGSSLQAVTFLPFMAGLYNLRVSGINGIPICGAMQLKIMAGEHPYTDTKPKFI